MGAQLLQFFRYLLPLRTERKINNFAFNPQLIVNTLLLLPFPPQVHSVLFT